MKRLTAVILAFCMLFCFASCVDDTDASNHTSSLHTETSASEISFDESFEGQLAVHYLDVGQGDSIFLELPGGSSMLIDASIAEYGESIVETIRGMGYERIDYVIATHPHADHIGGMRTVLNAFEIGCIYLPDASASTNTYIKLAETILEREIDAIVAEAGVVVLDSEDLHAQFLAPRVIDEDDQNRNSAVLSLTYGETKFLFMGDADTSIEDSLGSAVDCDVLKVGHHGSRTASGEQFLRYASPAYAIVSCGEGNSYGHPHEEAVARLTASGASILRTDLLGTITVRSNGTELAVFYGNVQQGNTSETSESSVADTTSSEGTATDSRWILNTNSKKIHDPSCSHAADIATHNRAESDKSIAELEQEGYTPCGVCKPKE